MFKDWTPPWRGGKEKDEKGAKERRDMRPDEPPVGGEAFASVREKPRDSFEDEQQSIFNVKEKIRKENEKKKEKNDKKDDIDKDAPQEKDPVEKPDQDEEEYIPGEQNKEPNIVPPGSPKQ